MEDLLRQAFKLGQQWVQDMNNDKEPINFNKWYTSNEVQQQLKKCYIPIVSNGYCKWEVCDDGVIGCFCLDDLIELSGTIQIPKLKEGIIDDGFAAWLEEQLYIKGHIAKWVSLDDMGFISISFSDGTVTDERMVLVLDILNYR